MTQYHTFTYTTPLAFLEEDEFTLRRVADEDYWQQPLSLDLDANISLWVEDNALPIFPSAMTMIDDDFWQQKLSWRHLLLLSNN